MAVTAKNLPNTLELIVQTVQGLLAILLASGILKTYCILKPRTVRFSTTHNKTITICIHYRKIMTIFFYDVQANIEVIISDLAEVELGI